MEKQKTYLGVRDIAKLCNVSVATVSRAINTPEKVSPGTLRKIQKVIQEHHYVPNLVAKNMYQQEGSRSIAIFILDLECALFVALIRSLNRIAFENGYTLLICNTENSREREQEYLRYCAGIRTQGIIFTEGYSNDIFDSCASNQVLVFHDRYVGPQYSTVACDNRRGIRMLVDYLYNLNHRKFAFVGGDPFITSFEERKSEFLATLREKDIEVPPEYIFNGIWEARTGVNAFDHICTLPDRPTAIVCANDVIARGFIMRANKMGLQVPEDFSVVGFDGYSPEYFYPKLTTVRQNVDMIAQNLFDCVTKSLEPRHIVVDVDLVIGDSCKKLLNS